MKSILHEAEQRMENHAFWLENLRSHKTLKELQKSEFFRICGAHIASYLQTARVYAPSYGTSPLLRSFLRIAQWNLEKGKRFNEILSKLQTDEVLKWADVIILNEADWGMVRSNNRHVARELGEALRMHTAFAPAHFELTKGTDEELSLAGENRESLQGNAILSRYPILETCIVPLPVTFEPYHFHERRYGWRSCLWARLQLIGSCIWAGAVHLELRNTPRCRARQMRHLISCLPGPGREPYVLGGDLNTNSFARGTRRRTVGSVLRLLFRSPDLMKEELLHPGAGNEPLFRIMRNGGFEWDQFNSGEETARTDLDALEETGDLPAPILRFIRKRLEPYHGRLCFKLDWLFGRGLQGITTGQIQDSRTGVGSLSPGVVKGENAGPGRISDHLPIYADIILA
jgi:endonuclease/exonuclease/phosphatase family metal-dependent hydrolase